MKLANGVRRERPMPMRQVAAQLGRDLAAPLLKRILLTIVVAGLLLSAFSAAVDFRTTLILAIGNAAIAAAMLAAARRGYSQTASVVVILALLVTTTYAMITGNGLFRYPALSAGRHVALTVTDSGIGIPPENIEKIFEPFFTTKESGTGMGLAAVQGTALEHQGAITVKSELGRGATFSLLLPLSETSAVEEPATLTAAGTTASGKVLVVDDEVTVASIVGRTLTRGGYEVELCHSGQGALDRYRPDAFDLVLLDVMMPDLDGVEVLKRIRAKAPTAKVMLMTGHASESVETRLREFSDVVVLSKPFQPKQLIEEVRKVIAH